MNIDEKLKTLLVRFETHAEDVGRTDAELSFVDDESFYRVMKAAKNAREQLERTRMELIKHLQSL